MALTHVGCICTVVSGGGAHKDENMCIGACRNSWSCVLLMCNWIDMDLQPSWTRMRIRM
jgi:hypothetical protein